MEQKRIYMDHAATTYVKPEELDAMTPYFTEHFGNPSSIHSFARETKKAIDHAREQVANAIGATPSEIFFTSGATESDNWALRGMAYQHTNKGNHIITTAIEHHAILHTCQALEKQGICVKVSDISDALNIPRPGVTRTVKEMETKGYLQKLSSPDDGRVTFITLTEAGKALSRKYDEHYFNELSSYLDDISEEDADCMIRTIGKFYEIMSERREHYEK